MRKKDQLGLIMLFERQISIEFNPFPKNYWSIQVLLFNKLKPAVGTEWLWQEHTFIFLCSIHYLFPFSLLYFHSTKALLFSVFYCLVTTGTPNPLTSLTILSSTDYFIKHQESLYIPHSVLQSTIPGPSSSPSVVTAAGELLQLTHCMKQKEAGIQWVLTTKLC